MVKKAQNWNYSSLSRRLSQNKEKIKLLSNWPIEEPDDYVSFVNTPLNNNEEKSIKYSISKSKPFGTDKWTNRVIKKYKLEATLRNVGRPKNGT